MNFYRSLVGSVSIGVIVEMKTVEHGPFFDSTVLNVLRYLVPQPRKKETAFDFVVN